MDSLFEEHSCLYSKGGEDHHHHNQKQHVVPAVKVTEEDTWKIMWCSIKTGGKHKLGCLNISSSKAAGGQQIASVSSKQNSAVPCRVLCCAQMVTRHNSMILAGWGPAGVKKNWSEVAASASGFQEQAEEIMKGVGMQAQGVRWLL